MEQLRESDIEGSQSMQAGLRLCYLAYGEGVFYEHYKLPYNHRDVPKDNSIDDAINARKAVIELRKLFAEKRKMYCFDRMLGIETDRGAIQDILDWVNEERNPVLDHASEPEEIIDEMGILVRDAKQTGSIKDRLITLQMFAEARGVLTRGSNNVNVDNRVQVLGAMSESQEKIVQLQRELKKSIKDSCIDMVCEDV